METPSPLHVLCVSDFYLPGFRGGGPARTIANLREALHPRAELSVFTRSRDLGENRPYAGLPQDRWTETENGSVFYASDRVFGPSGLKRAIGARKFHLLYLNSFFSPDASIKLLLFRNLIREKSFRIPVVLAPRGEFSEAALKFKAAKKYLYLQTAKRLGLYNNIFWHASTSEEARQIEKIFPAAQSRIFTAIDAVAPQMRNFETLRSTEGGTLKIAFISRIAPVKNLDLLLDLMGSLKKPVVLNIYGPVESEAYWNRCRTLIAGLPTHIRATYHGPLRPDQVSATFARHDLFVLPTQSENFGHIIFEALRAGTPVLISSNTPWKSSEGDGITVLPLEDMQAWCDRIDSMADMSQAQRLSLREDARAAAREAIALSDNGRATLAMFEAVVARAGSSF